MSRAKLATQWACVCWAAAACSGSADGDSAESPAGESSAPGDTGATGDDPGSSSSTDPMGDDDDDDDDGTHDDDDDNDPDDPGDFVFDETQVRHFVLTLAPEDWAWLNDNAREEEYVPATLDYAGQQWTNIAVRYKGGYGSLESCFVGNVLVCDKLSLKIKFDEYVDDQEFFGLSRINLHSMERDPTKVHDRLAYGLFRDFGVHAPRAVHARVVVNGESLGLYVAVEQIDKHFVRHRFGSHDAGNLYKEAWPLHSDEQVYLDALEYDREGASVEKMMAFTAELQDAEGPNFGATLDRWMDRSTLANYLAVDRAIENWDGIMGWWCEGADCANHNYYWYEDPSRDRFWLVPWDLDYSFDVPNRFEALYGEPAWQPRPASCTPYPIGGNIGRRGASCDHIIEQMAAALWPDYVSAAQSLLDTLLSEAELHARIDRYAAQIADEVAADPVLASTTWNEAVTKLRADVLELRAQLKAEIDAR